jgi:uncharacterized membrane protein
MIKKIIASITFLIIISNPFPIHAQEIPGTTLTQMEATDSAFIFPKDEYFTGTILSVEEKPVEMEGEDKQLFQKMKIKITNGNEKNKTIDVEQNILITGTKQLKKGDNIVLIKSTIGDNMIYQIIDRYRMEPVLILIASFFVLAIGFGKIKGFSSIVGLAVSILVIIKFIIPQISAGSNPFVITLVGVLIIAFTSLYLAHGFSKKTTLALISTLITLGISIVLAKLSVDLTQLTGMGSEEALFLQLGPLSKLNLQGLLLGGIIIGTLGVLDDITTSQTAAIDEISKANPELKFNELYKRGVNVGHEHIASLVNTLFLAYAGSSLPLFLLFTQSQEQPFWLILNNEQFVEEIVRTVVGSIALILAVPISTILASYYFSNRINKPTSIK